MEGSSAGFRKGAWTEEENILLKKYIEEHGEGKWHQVSSKSGLNRCRKSCRLRWLNYLSPNIKRRAFADDEVDLIIRLHNLLGNRWSLIAGRLPGRTANDVKNYYATHLLKKKLDLSFNPNLRPKSIGSTTQYQCHQTSASNLKKSFPAYPDKYRKINTAATSATTSAPSSKKSLSPNIDNNGSYCFPDENGEIMWWESLMMNDDETNYQQQQGLIGDIDPSVLREHTVNEELEMIEEENCDSLGELYLDAELWNVFNT